MTKLFIQNRYYDKNFVQVKIPRLLLKLIISEMHKSKYKYAFNLLYDIYGITSEELIRCISKNIVIREIEDATIIYINDTAKLNNGTKLRSALAFLDSGNLETRGTNILSKVFTYISNNLNVLYKLSVVKGGSSLWQ